MTDQKPTAKWLDTSSRFVGFFDIMGFKELMLRVPHESVQMKLMGIHEISQTIHDHDDSKELLLKCVKFSDSIVLISNDDSEESAVKIIQASAWLIAGALAKRVPLKGAIAFGLFTADFINSLYFGQPLIDAFLLQNELKLYGAILHHTAEKRLSELNVVQRSSLCVPYETPMSIGTVRHVNIDWLDPADFNKVDLISLEESLYHSVSGNPRKYVDNTFAFVKAIRSKKRENQSETGLDVKRVAGQIS